MIGTIERPSVFDVVYIAKNAREEDKKEAYLLSGGSIGESFELTPGLYDNSYVWNVDGKVVCMYGITPVGEKTGVLWMLATDEFENYKNCFMRECKKVFEDLIKGYDYLFNSVHAEHKKALRWIKWLGCTIKDPEPIGINGEMFCKFEVKNV